MLTKKSGLYQPHAADNQIGWFPVWWFDCLIVASHLVVSWYWNRALRSTSCGRWMGRTRRIPALRSTSVGRWRGKPRWSHRSIRSIYALVGRWSWSSLCWEPRRWSPSAFCRRYRGTCWYHRRGRCWRTDPYGYQCRTSWYCCRWSHGFRRIPFLWRGDKYLE